METCSFHSENSACHQLTDYRKLENSELTVLKLRTEKELSNESTICEYHEKQFLTQYSRSCRTENCADPFNRHTAHIKKSLKTISFPFFEKHAEKVLPFKVVPGQKWCISCRKEVQKVLDNYYSEDEGSEHPQSTSQTYDINTAEANSILASLELTPVKKKGLTESKKRKKGKEKLVLAQKVLKTKLESSFDVTFEDSDCDEKVTLGPDDIKDLHNFKEIMSELKEKYKNSESFSDRIQILTLSPYSVRRTMQEFNASQWMVKKSRDVKKEKGILGVPGKKKGKVLKEEVKSDVIKFYECDDNSRMCPGQKDYVSVVNKEGDKIKMQKRMVLSNLKELHAAWKTKNTSENKISFSTFAGLRPRHCILAGAAGTHSVCVCKIHQNPKLMCQTVGLNYKDLMALTVCSVNSEACMLRQCKECPGGDPLRDFLQNFLEGDDDITYNQWVSTDRTTLNTFTQPKCVFIEKLIESVISLSRHSFIAKAQSEYMQYLKDNLKVEQVIIQMDFSENYSYVLQDEIQSYHWENLQCTLHPIVSYMKINGELVSNCACILSDHKSHSTAAVHCFLDVYIPYLQTVCPSVEIVYYFTDGSAAQYKNKFNFLNLCLHKNDFGIDAE